MEKNTIFFNIIARKMLVNRFCREIIILFRFAICFTIL